MLKKIFGILALLIVTFVFAADLVKAAPLPPPPSPLPTAVPRGPVLKGCSNPWGGPQGFDTAIGCIPFLSSAGKAETTGIAGFFLTWGMGIGGGIAMLLIVYSAYMIMSSSGDPHRLQAGKELLTSALSGLLLLIFSVYLLRLIGVDILSLPGL